MFPFLFLSAGPPGTGQGCTLVSPTDLALPPATRHPMALPRVMHGDGLHAPLPQGFCSWREIPGEFDSDSALLRVSGEERGYLL